MSYSIKFNPDTDCIVLIFEHNVTMKSLKEAALRAGQMFEETRCNRILNDRSAATMDLSFMEIFSSPAITDEAKIARTAKRALLLPSNFQDASFLENVSQNKGHHLKVFNDLESAEKWLFSY
jgi:hypothetical protein